MIPTHEGALYVAPMSLLGSIRLGLRRCLDVLYLCGLGLAFFACSPAPAPVSESSRDPSSPRAPEGVTPFMVASVSQTGTAGGGAHDHGASGHHDHGASAAVDGGAQGVVYVCPMHPEVTSTKQGLCPKCNMKLVPKK
jgi:hypothetical protein